MHTHTHVLHRQTSYAAASVATVTSCTFNLSGIDHMNKRRSSRVNNNSRPRYYSTASCVFVAEKNSYLLHTAFPLALRFSLSTTCLLQTEEEDGCPTLLSGRRSFPKLSDSVSLSVYLQQQIQETYTTLISIISPGASRNNSLRSKT